jgi:hypothetical protein
MKAYPPFVGAGFISRGFLTVLTDDQQNEIKGMEFRADKEFEGKECV